MNYATGSRMGFGGGSNNRKKKKKKKKQRKTVQLSRIINDSIVKGTYLKKFLKNTNELDVVQYVDFSTANANGVFNNKYIVWIAEKMPKDRSVIFLFPNHPIEKMRTLRVSQINSMDSLGRSINTRFQGSLNHTDHGGDVRIAMAYGNHIYVFQNVTGTIYLSWAQQATKQGFGGGNATNIGHMIPVIINMDGSTTAKSIFFPQQDVEQESDLDTVLFSVKRLQDGSVVPGKWPQIIINTAYIDYLYSCEKDTRKPPATKIKTMNRQQVLKMMANSKAGNRNKAARRELRSNPFGASIDQEDIIEEEEESDSSSMEVVPMHRSMKTGGHMIYEDGTRALGELTMVSDQQRNKKTYDVVETQKIRDPGISDCGTYRFQRDVMVFKPKERRGSPDIISASSPEISEESTTPPSSSRSMDNTEQIYRAMSPWEDSGEEEEEEEDTIDEEENDDDERNVLTNNSIMASE